MNQRSAGHLNRACGCTTGPPAFPHSHRSYLQMPRFAITFAFLASATFSSVLLCFSPLLRSRRREMDHVRTTSSAHQCRRQRPSPFEQGGSPSYLCFAPVRGATSKLHSRGRSVPSRPEQTTTPSRTSLRPPGCKRRPLASLGHAPDSAADGSRSTERQLTAPLVDVPAFASTNRHDSVSTLPLVAQSLPQPLSYPTHNPLPYPWPTAPPYNSSVRLPPLKALAPMPTIPPLLPLVSSAPGADPSVRPPPLMAQALTPAIPPLLPPVLPTPGADPSLGPPPLMAQAPVPAIPPLFPPFLQLSHPQPSQA